MASRLPLIGVVSVARRVADAAIVLLFVSAVIFAALRLSGDPVSMMVDPSAPSSTREALRRDLGLDRPLVEQYWRFLTGALRGDFGRSIRYDDSALAIILDRLPATIELAAAVVAVSLAAALLMTVVSVSQVKKGNTKIDRGIRVLTAVGPAIPAFWLGVMLIELLALRLGWLPTSGRGSWSQLIMPTLCLSLQPTARLTRLLRATVLVVLRRPFVAAARARGAMNARLFGRHVLPNALAPFIAELSTQVALLLGGAAIVESVFAWPGVGQLTIQSIGSRDYPLVQAIVVVGATIVLLVNLASELAQAWLDPAVRDAE